MCVATFAVLAPAASAASEWVQQPPGVTQTTESTPPFQTVRTLDFVWHYGTAVCPR